ncbi:TauD/TfdA family dioxygenase [Lentzea sp. NPDC060358]|uniref:TauD/TfdA family dioxygenase n=1 Tax=Lentzea sp. NPDC060358 TaxID=3347103 RepID=UPI003667C161
MVGTAAEAPTGPARRLHDLAVDRARSGHTADDFLRGGLPLPGDLLDELREHIAPPDREAGTRTVRGLLDPFLPVGPTPLRWGLPQTPELRALDIAIATIALAVGHPFGWAGQQGGRLVHDIVPTQGFETMQVGASSQTPLEWHTEDAFHPERAHLVALVCLRNPDGIGSRVSSVRDLDLTGAEMDVLRRRDSRILPDDSYPESWQAGGGEDGVAAVWDADDGPCLRYDPAYTRFLTEDPEFRAVYDKLAVSLERASTVVDIQAGDVLLIDNDLVVHGRNSFTPRYDGTDRWLKRILLHLDRPRPADAATEHRYDQPIRTVAGRTEDRRG